MIFGKDRQRLKELEKRQAEADSNYTQIITDALVDAAIGDMSGAYVGALEIAAGALSRAFASADVSGPDAVQFDSWTMAQIGRALVEEGDSLWWYDRSSATLRRVRNYSFLSNRQYALNFPNGTQMQTSDVFHVRWNISLDNGFGLGPLSLARNLQRMCQLLETSIAAESSAAVGYLLPIPTDGQSATVENLRKDIADLKGKIAVIETARQGWGQGVQQGPRREFELQRLGPSIPASSVDAWQAATHTILAACGYPVQLAVNTDGTSQREAWRRYLHGTVAPLARLVEQAAIESGFAIEISFEQLFASDIQGRARAFKSLVDGGMPLEQAAATSGILQPES